jgi:hypothetical protein
VTINTRVFETNSLHNRFDSPFKNRNDNLVSARLPEQFLAILAHNNIPSLITLCHIHDDGYTSRRLFRTKIFMPSKPLLFYEIPFIPREQHLLPPL